MSKKTIKRWKHIFDKLAEEKDIASQTGRIIEQFKLELIAADIKNKLKIKFSDRIIDVGCGNGAITALIAQETPQVVGVDFSQKLLAQVRKRANVHYYLAESTNLPFGDNLFDKGLCYSVIHYLENKELVSTLKELSRVCKPGARILIGDIPDANKMFLYLGWGGFFKYLIKKFILGPFQLPTYLTKNPGWGFYGRKSLQNICHQLDLETQIIEQPKNLPYSWYRYDLLIINTK